MANEVSHFGISARMQYLMCLIGQKEVFEEGAETFKEMLNVDVCDNQIKRVSEYYGSQLEVLIKKNCKKILPALPVKKVNEYTYAMMDGSMLLTREDGWREIKLGRLFNQSQIIDIQSGRRIISDSIFVSHLGNCHDFFLKFERHLVGIKKLVILGDGAKWIWVWVENNYPGAIQILDIFHALEKLAMFAKQHYKNEQEMKTWLEVQKTKLLENQVEGVIENLKSLRTKSKEATLKKNEVITYFEENEDRMQYKTYREDGLMIGSGPIEAAHRNVIQGRLKLSGQRWSIDGAQAIANLRCYKKGNNWDIILSLIKKAA